MTIRTQWTLQLAAERPEWPDPITALSDPADWWLHNMAVDMADPAPSFLGLYGMTPRELDEEEAFLVRALLRAVAEARSRIRRDGLDL